MPDGGPAADQLEVDRLLLVVTGALTATYVPFWLNWLKMACPATDVRVVLSEGAGRFVTPTAVGALTGGQVLADAWPDGPTATALHVELAQWPQAIVVFPASFHYLSRLANGITDTPSTLALQCTDAPVVIAPSLPPGGDRSPGYLRHLRALSEYPNFTVVPPIAGYSAATGRMDAPVAAPLPDLLLHVRRRLDARAA